MRGRLRILSEFLEPLAHFRREKIRDTVVFFGSARMREEGPLAQYYQDARTLAATADRMGGQFTNSTYRFVVCSGGGPGIMEAANRGAHDASGKTMGLNIGLPFEQFPNPYITPELSFEFHYFFMRKFWFAYLAKALVVFPGGFGTLDEMMEMLTLVQTQKLAKKMTIVLYGSSYWKEIVNFDALVKIRHDLARGPEPVPVCRRPADGLRAAQDRPDDLRHRSRRRPRRRRSRNRRNPQKPSGTE